jgi:hypothetical protein
MQITITVKVDVDPEAWAATFGIERRDVRQDVKDYITNAVTNLLVLDECKSEGDQT